jgi:hypothetical protein
MTTIEPQGLQLLSSGLHEDDTIHVTKLYSYMRPVNFEPVQQQYNTIDCGVFMQWH